MRQRCFDVPTVATSFCGSGNHFTLQCGRCYSQSRGLLPRISVKGRPQTLPLALKLMTLFVTVILAAVAALTPDWTCDEAPWYSLSADNVTGADAGAMQKRHTVQPVETLRCQGHRVRMKVPQPVAWSLPTRWLDALGGGSRYFTAIHACSAALK